MANAFFVAGTDTDVGKTVISCALLELAKSKGLSTLALKPLAAGCEQTAEGLRNDDALRLLAHSGSILAYQEINPVALPAAVSPHIAAEWANRRITASQLVGFTRGTLMRWANFKLVEGAGGWRVPINDREFYSSVVRELGLPVVLVVGVRIGCLNHAVLTAEAITRDGLKLAGWVANVLDPEMEALEQNIETLKKLFNAPCLGVVPWDPLASAEQRAKLLTLPT